MAEDKANAAVLDELFAVVESRKGGDPSTSYTAKLFAKGRAHIAKKFGEEAVEAVIAATSQQKAEVIAESADVLFHLLVLWAERGIKPADVYAELEKRKGLSGLDEKKRRTE
jgi:phosphoribosyl-ATP pyrophosphohydrolase